MITLKKELVKQIIIDVNLSNPKDIGDHLEDMFKDVIQEMLERAISLELDYEKGYSKIKSGQ